MRATVLLLLQRDRVRRVITEIRRNKASRDGRAVELIESISALMVLEQAAIQLFEAREEDISRQGFAHDRARALLFRIVTADGANRAIERSLEELEGVFGARSDRLRERLSASLDDAALARLGRRLEALVHEPTLGEARGASP